MHVIISGDRILSLHNKKRFLFLSCIPSVPPPKKKKKEVKRKKNNFLSVKRGKFSRFSKFMYRYIFLT